MPKEEGKSLTVNDHFLADFGIADDNFGVEFNSAVAAL
jgi:hypothetical protein